MIIWSREKLDVLRSAIAMAEEDGLTVFSVKLDRRDKPVEFTISEARRTLDDISRSFAAVPPQTFPPNREGPEP